MFAIVASLDELRLLPSLASGGTSAAGAPPSGSAPSSGSAPPSGSVPPSGSASGAAAHAGARRHSRRAARRRSWARCAARERLVAAASLGASAHVSGGGSVSRRRRDSAPLDAADSSSTAGGTSGVTFGGVGMAGPSARRPASAASAASSVVAAGRTWTEVRGLKYDPVTRHFLDRDKNSARCISDVFMWRLMRGPGDAELPSYLARGPKLLPLRPFVLRRPPPEPAVDAASVGSRRVL